MRLAIRWVAGLIGCACAVSTAIGAVTVAPPHPVAGGTQSSARYRLGSTPRPEFKVAGQSFKIDPDAMHVKRVRALVSEDFDPIKRRDRVPEFYRGVLKEHYDEFVRLPRHHVGPFRWEFVYWTTRWPMALRARWAYHHRRYIEELLWARWMAEAEFAAAIRAMETQHVPLQDGYLPPEYASTSPAFIYSDEYLEAAYNPVPFLAVMNLTSLKADPQSDWIGKAATQSLTTQLSALPGMYVVENDRVAGALGAGRRTTYVDLADPTRAAQLGRAVEAQQVVMGSYVADGDHVLFNLRLVDTETGKVIHGISKAVARDHVLEALPDFATALAGALSPSAASPQSPSPGSPGPTVATGADPPARHRTSRSRTNDLPAGAIESDMVGGHGGGAFVHVDPNQAPVVGFRYSIGHWARRDVLRQLDPVFAGGAAADDPDPRLQTILARDGYIVGGLLVDTDGLNAVAVRVLFVRTKADGRPDADAGHYLSDWVGGPPSGITRVSLGGHGERVLGTFGHKGLNLDAVGLVFAPPAADAPLPAP